MKRPNLIRVIVGVLLVVSIVTLVVQLQNLIEPSDLHSNLRNANVYTDRTQKVKDGYQILIGKIVSTDLVTDTNYFFTNSDFISLKEVEETLVGNSWKNTKTTDTISKTSQLLGRDLIIQNIDLSGFEGVEKILLLNQYQDKYKNNTVSIDDTTRMRLSSIRQSTEVMLTAKFKDGKIDYSYTPTMSKFSGDTKDVQRRLTSSRSKINIAIAENVISSLLLLIGFVIVMRKKNMIKNL